MSDISVVIPTRNRADYLEVCLDVLRKEMSDSPEIHVVDDCSEKFLRNANKKTAKRYGCDYFFLEKNRGMAVARNMGVRRSKGEWIVFLDDDVKVTSGWYNTLCTILPGLSPDVIGIEGRVEACGAGLWDREVENLHGGSFLTCHIVYRRSVFENAGGFDEAFEYLGPFCEDHEFAARVMQEGKIMFVPELKAVHMPRRFRFLEEIMKSRMRMRGLLRAEKYFYNKHPDKYCRFRYFNTFRGTYNSILFRHTVHKFRKRSMGVLIGRPLEAVMLMILSVWEQFQAWTLLPSLAAGKELPEKTGAGREPDWAK